jgi:cell division protein FtsL
VNKAWARQRAQLFAEELPPDASSRPLPPSAPHNTDTVGRDFARLRSRGQRPLRLWLAIAVGTLAAALMVASLRVSILQLRYQLSAAVSEETALLARQREVTVDLRELRDPTRLRDLATKQGFARPERVIQLSVPATGLVEATP